MTKTAEVEIVDGQAECPFCKCICSVYNTFLDSCNHYSGSAYNSGLYVMIFEKEEDEIKGN